MMSPRPQPVPHPLAPNPYAPPQAPAYGAFPPGPPGHVEQPPRVEGDRVTLGKGYAFPPLCVKCGATEHLRTRSQRFAWFPKWTYFLLLAGLLPLIIVQMVMTKRAHLLLPVCAPCNSRWTTARVLRSLAILGPVVVGLGLAFLGVANDWGWLIVTGFLVFFPGILVVVPIDLILVRRRTLQAVFIDDRAVTLKGVAHPVLDVMARG